MTSFDNSEFKISIGNYEFSFREELRIFSTEALIATEGRRHLENWIIEKMRVAYGDKSKVDVSDFQKERI
jgi:hypothetical protein